MAKSSRRRLRGVQALERDIVAELQKPVVAGRFWLDLEAPLDWLASDASPSDATITHVFVQAAARAAMATPDAHRMLGPFSQLEPESADVGVSIEGRGILAPVIVLEACDRKGIGEIAVELREKTTETRAQEVVDAARIDRFLRVFPFPLLRRWIARALLSSPRFRRRVTGTLQISNIGHFGIDGAYVPLASDLLLVIGAIEKRVLVDDDDAIVARRGLELWLHASHRRLNGRIAGDYARALRKALSAPIA